MSPLLGEAHRPTYRVIDRISAGAQSDPVFLTHHEIFDGTFVQKTVYMHGLDDTLAGNEPAFMKRLRHQRIVPVLEAQWDPEQERAITFVMPHMAGGSVHDALFEDHRFSLYETIAIGIDALDALAYVHREHRALHRDTKPGNVLLDESREHGYLSDFGSAAPIQDDHCASAVLGTNIYRPPESRLTDRVGVSADIYGIGLMLFEMLSGRIAWETLELEAVERRLTRGQRAISDSSLLFAPHVPNRLRRVVRKMIARDPTSRFATADDAITALRQIPCIDWRRTDGAGPLGVWHGTWPPHTRPEQTVDYRVVAGTLNGGPRRGAVRAEADFRLCGGGWRQAAPDITFDPSDVSQLSSYFQQVEASAFHRSPAR